MQILTTTKYIYSRVYSLLDKSDPRAIYIYIYICIYIHTQAARRRASLRSNFDIIGHFDRAQRALLLYKYRSIVYRISETTGFLEDIVGIGQERVSECDKTRLLVLQAPVTLLYPVYNITISLLCKKGIIIRRYITISQYIYM